MYKLYYTFIIGIILSSSLQAAPARFVHEYTKNGVSVKLQEIPPKEAKRELGYGFKMRKKPNTTVPVSVTLTNDSNRAINFSKRDLGLTLVSPHDVKRQAESRAVLYACGGLLTLLFIVCPLAAIYGIELCFGGPAKVAMILGSINIVGILSVIAPTDCCSYKWYDEKKSVRSRIVTPYEEFDAIQVAPYERLTKVVYVKRKDLPQY